ncbi:MAG: MmgE/PrpD family protein, partial [Acetobacteraceae bacterium]
MSAPTLAEHLGGWLAGTSPARLPTPVIATARRLLLDVSGLIVAARNEDYVQATLAATEPGGCTALGQPDGRDPFSAALVNGTAAHGEDFDDTFEGGPVHSSAVIVP